MWVQCAKLADYQIFSKLPGAGPVFSARLLAAFGEIRERFTDAGALQRYAGVAPVLERSGQKNWVHWRYASSRFVRQTFVEWAASSIAKSSWAEKFYRLHRSKGASRNATLRALASSGSAFCSAAGSTGSPTMRPSTSRRCRRGTRRCSRSPRRAQIDVTPRRPQGVGWALRLFHKEQELPIR